MKIAILLIVCTIATVWCAKDCLRSGVEQDTVSYANDQPLRKAHKLAMDRIKIIYAKHSKELGGNPFMSLEFAEAYSLSLKHFTVLMGPGNLYSLESLSAIAQGTKIGPVDYSANLKTSEVVILPKGVFDSTHNRCNQTALLNSVQQL